MFIVSPTFNFKWKDECIVVAAFEKWKNDNVSCEDPVANNTWVRLEKIGDQCFISAKSNEEYERTYEKVKLVGKENREFFESLTNYVKNVEKNNYDNLAIAIIKKSLVLFDKFKNNLSKNR